MSGGGVAVERARSERVGRPGAERRRRGRQRWAWPRGDLLPPLRRTRRPPWIQQRSTDDRTRSRLGGRGRVEPRVDGLANDVLRRRPNPAGAAAGRARHRAHRPAQRRQPRIGRRADRPFAAASRSWAAGPTEGRLWLAPRPRPSLTAASAARRSGGQRAHCARSTAIPPPDEETRLRQHGTAVLLRLSLAASSRFAPSTSPSAPSSLRGRARSQFHDWLRSPSAPTAFMKGAVGDRSLTVSLLAALSVGSDGVREERCRRPWTAFNGAPRLRDGA